jgi:hypothetical protein
MVKDQAQLVGHGISLRLTTVENRDVAQNELITSLELLCQSISESPG